MFWNLCQSIDETQWHEQLQTTEISLAASTGSSNLITSMLVHLKVFFIFLFQKFFSIKPLTCNQL